MQPSFIDILHEILREQGKPIEIFDLVEMGLKIKPVKKAKHLLCQEIYRASQEKYSNFVIRQRPNFKILNPDIKPNIPKQGYVVMAYKILCQYTSRYGENTHFALRSIVRQAEADRKYPISRIDLTNDDRCPEFWLYAAMKERNDIFGQSDYLKIGLKNKRIKLTSKENPIQKQEVVYKKFNEINEVTTNLTRNIHEANLETLIADNLEYIEAGMELIKRQFVCSGVGRIDLFCEDKEKNLVIIEIKKFGVKHDSLIDQIARYMGYIKRHIAKENQNVRGIIVVGKIDEKLDYAVSAFSNIEVKTFKLSIE